ncbi:MAG TPA: hypothetical protein VLJ61_04945 [Pyrinomonadaceae bacterium]|nr:hypothetical protein [Pyrinomonadaceae bacterium]
MSHAGEKPRKDGHQNQVDEKDYDIEQDYPILRLKNFLEIKQSFEINHLLLAATPDETMR